MYRFNQHLEDAVLAGLVPVVTAIVGWSLLSSFAILRCSDQSLLKQLISGIGGLALGSAGFHVTIVLFGAPVVECVPIQLGTNFLVADARLIPILQQSMATDTLARCAAFELHDHALGAAVFDVCSSKMAPLAARPQVHLEIVLSGDELLHLWFLTLLSHLCLDDFVCRVTNMQELYLACSSIGAVLGAYLGAFPIPLDWDRPWQVRQFFVASCWLSDSSNMLARRYCSNGR